MTKPTITVKWNTGAKDGSPMWTDKYPIPEKHLVIKGVVLDSNQKKNPKDRQ